MHANIGLGKKYENIFIVYNTEKSVIPCVEYPLKLPSYEFWESV